MTEIPSLTGCYLLIDSSTENCYSICRFATRLDDTLYLAQILDPHSGEPFAYEGRFIINLHELTLVTRQEDIGWPRVRIFSSWDECRRFIDEIDGPRPDSVVKLVRPSD